MSVITIENWRRGGDDDPERYRALEEGHILFFPRTPFELSDEDRAVMRAQRMVQSGYHKNIAYKPARDRVTNFDRRGGGDEARLRDLMRRYSQTVVEFTRELLPRYAGGMRVDYASLRTEEEAGRQLPVRLRNDLLHVDAFPTRPTHGDRILRVFTNINPERPRVWVIKETFEPLATRFAASSGLLDRAVRGRFRRAAQRLARALGLPVPARSAYDEFMLAFHHFLKQNGGFQQEEAGRTTVSFPPGSTWVVFTDVASHSAQSGQYLVEQTLLVSREALAWPDRAPISILERMSGATLH